MTQVDDLLAKPPAPHSITVLHCSDLHFGAGFLRARLDQLANAINSRRPDAVVVSGDLTMRARPGQFRDARAFLETIEAPLLVIPGNHDVPLFNVVARLARPFQNYRDAMAGRWEGPLLLPGVGIVGMNTVNPWRHQEGIVRERELVAAEEWLRSRPAEEWKVVVVHQHWVDVPGHERPGVMPRAEEVLKRLSSAGAHAVLNGHAHFGRVASAAEEFRGWDGHRPVVIVQAGTATSIRTRGLNKVNSLNLLEFMSGELVVRGCDYMPEEEEFAPCRAATFRKSFFGEAEPSAIPATTGAAANS